MRPPFLHLFLLFGPLLCNACVMLCFGCFPMGQVPRGPSISLKLPEMNLGNFKVSLCETLVRRICGGELTCLQQPQAPLDLLAVFHIQSGDPLAHRAGKQAKRRQWRMKRACFEEGSQSAVVQYPLIGLSRRCILSWVISALRAALRRLRSETRLRA